ncbi:hypothetical protein RQP46_002872 [Phenoliferia psychrophenolica]
MVKAVKGIPTEADFAKGKGSCHKCKAVMKLPDPKAATCSMCEMIYCSALCKKVHHRDDPAACTTRYEAVAGSAADDEVVIAAPWAARLQGLLKPYLGSILEFVDFAVYSSLAGPDKTNSHVLQLHLFADASTEGEAEDVFKLVRCSVPSYAEYIAEQTRVGGEAEGDRAKRLLDRWDRLRAGGKGDGKAYCGVVLTAVIENGDETIPVSHCDLLASSLARQEGAKLPIDEDWAEHFQGDVERRPKLSDVQYFTLARIRVRGADVKQYTAAMEQAFAQRAPPEELTEEERRKIRNAKKKARKAANKVVTDEKPSGLEEITAEA